MMETPDQIKKTIERRALAFRMNESGWETQTKNIEAYLAEKP